MRSFGPPRRRAGKQGVMLVLENEFECNTATGREAVRTLNAVSSPHFALNWDPGNAVMRGELDAFPAGWDLLPKDRIHHCHCKNAVKNDAGKIMWSPVDKGYIDWAAQFRALKQAGYRDAVSLETHWHGGRHGGRIDADQLGGDEAEAGGGGGVLVPSVEHPAIWSPTFVRRGGRRWATEHLLFF